MTYRSVLPYLMAMAVSASALAGELSPPAGPVAPTGRFGPRVEVNTANTPGDADSLFKITQPGSYYLGGNVTGVAGKHGIEISVSSVVLDLNGFTLTGVANSLDGIVLSSTSADAITVRNGVVKGWGSNGVELRPVLNVGGTGCLIEGIHALDNALTGIHGMNNGIIRDCTGNSNGSTGISLEEGGVAERCIAQNNSTGIAGNPGAVVRACTSADNTLFGIATSVECLVVNCNVRGGQVGITVSDWSMVINCNVAVTSSAGIGVTSRCMILENMVSFGGSSGFRINGIGNRIEGNYAVQSGVGFDVNGDSNLLIRNASTGNSTNFNIVSSNFCKVVQGVRSGAIIGDSGGVSIGTTDPWANIAY